jgi:hypothetical protein
MYDEAVEIPWIDIKGVASNYIATEFVKIEPYFFENEVRAVFFSKSIIDRISRKIDFESLVDEIYLSPFANAEVIQKTKELLLSRIDEKENDPRVVRARDAEQKLLSRYKLEAKTQYVPFGDYGYRIRVTEIGDGEPVVLVPGF